uniref:addiction module toxin RelE n=1 Tax=Castellaniella defragrans TaxID=75697 RepID=UPI00333F2FFB
MSETLQGIVELPSYIRLAERLFTEKERQDLIDHLAECPKSGAIMEGTGGVRKLRWGRGSQGKRGGARVIYYYHDDIMPLYLLALFAKSDKESLSKAERNDLADLVGVLVGIWKERKNHEQRIR